MKFRIPTWFRPESYHIRSGLVWRNKDKKRWETMVYYIPELPHPQKGKEYLSEYMKFRAFCEQPDLTDDHEFCMWDLFPHQKEGISFFRKLNGGVGAHTVGAGKTVMSLAAFLRNRNSHVFVVCEASKKDDWALEAMRAFDFGPQQVKFVQGGDSDRRRRIYNQCPNVLILNYELLMNDEKHLKHIIQHYDAIIVDEAHRIKTITTKGRTILDRLPPPQTPRIALTATPHEISLMELFSICSWACPHYFPPHKQFYKRFVGFDYWGNPRIRRQSDFNWIISPIILRRTWDDIDREIPNIKSHIIWHGLSPDQKKWYRSYLYQAKHSKGDRRLGWYSKMLNVCLSPQAVEKEGASEKLTKLKNLIHRLIEEGNNVVAFSRSKKFVVQCVKEFREYRPAVIHGSKKDRGKEKNKFGRSTPLIFLTSAGERGLNLQRGNIVINMDVPSNPARFRQRVGRILRLGQEAEEVHVYTFVAKNTIENRFLDLCMSRSLTFDKFVQGGSSDSLSSVMKRIKINELDI